MKESFVVPEQVIDLRRRAVYMCTAQPHESGLSAMHADRVYPWTAGSEVEAFLREPESHFLRCPEFHVCGYSDSHIEIKHGAMFIVNEREE